MDAFKGRHVLLTSDVASFLFVIKLKPIDTNFLRSQTTKGIWIARCVGIEPCTLVMDLEGTDGREREEDDTAFEKESSLFALAISDMINMWCHDIGRHDEIITLMFVIRDKTRTPLENLEPVLREDIQKIWDGVPKPQAHKETPLSEFFNVEVVALSSFEEKEEQFKEQVESLRQRFFHSIAPGGLAGDRRAVVPASGFSFSAQQSWKIIKVNKDLDLPAHKVMVATVRCEEIANEKFSSFTENEEWCQLEETVQSQPVPGFGRKLSSILDACLSEYDAEATYFDEGARSSKHSQLEEKLMQESRSEIILSSGAIGSPQLLLLSGIRPKSLLEKLNISVVLDNEFVGKGMSDNPMNVIYVPASQPVEQSLVQTVGITKMRVYIEASSGFGKSSDSIHWDHVLVSADIGQLSTIPPKQRTHEAFKGGFILEKVVSPLSTGHLNLLNTNVDDNPSVTFNYFSHPSDLQRRVDGVRLIEKISRSKHFTNYMKCDGKTVEKRLNMSVQANVRLIPKHTNDTKSLEQFCKDNVNTIWHYHGGCHVGKVVGPDHRVLGVERLRVIDGSTFSKSPGANPQATVMMMGRYMGLKILGERLGRAAGA
ncbi:unnamed protein product [Fraxinus pennsylvanica]|uniref:GB1/RHD3-type G domain-containing protein n=1 Tax=Fraxinus pennsylvanica TaxID=56036 RepID=A0AAD2E3G8_9LAMI|nr:unnamed protein product [Fraxinus pennsylvanica]